MKSNCDTALKSVPPVAGDAFMEAYQYQAPEDAVTAAAKTILSDAAVSAFLSLPDSFQAGGLDAALVTCSVIYQAGPTGLAAFATATNATGNEALVDQLLTTPLLMRDMLVAGGATSRPNRKGFDKNFGEAMAIYAKILKASAVLDYDEVMASYRVNTSAAASDTTPWDDHSTANASNVLQSPRPAPTPCR